MKALGVVDFVIVWALVCRMMMGNAMWLSSVINIDNRAPMIMCLASSYVKLCELGSSS